MFEIEKGIPTPHIDDNGRKGAARKTAEVLEVGDSFVIPDGAASPRSMVAMAGHLNKVLHPKRFAGRKAEGGRRIWRVE